MKDISGIIVMVGIFGLFALPFIMEGWSNYLTYKQNIRQLEIKRIQEEKNLQEKKIELAKEMRLSKNINDLNKLMDN